MKTFKQWMKENSIRTSLGIMPPLAGAGIYPPLYYSPISGGASLAMSTIHKHHPECYKKKKKKRKKKN